MKTPSLLRFVFVFGIAAIFAAGGAHAGPRRAGASQANATGDPQQRVSDFIAKWDKDGDKMLSATELAAAFTAMRERAQEHRGQQAGGASSGNAPAHTRAGAGAGAAAKTPQQRAEAFVSKFDKNGDGKLDATELVAGFAELREHIAEHRRQHQGQGGANTPGSTTQPAQPAQ
jgi:hypothetical protein